MAPSSVTAVGQQAERQALAHLEARGLQTIDTNFRCRFGEIDIVMLDRDCLVFIEVRYRQRNRFVTAAASVDELKQKKLIRTAAVFLARHPRFSQHAVRFDVLAIDAAPGDSGELQWLRDAFRAED